MTLNTISTKQVYKSTQGNDIWAYVIVDGSSPISALVAKDTSLAADIQDLLLQYADLFQEPAHLPPHRAYDHAVPLYPDAVPINSRP